MSLKMLNRVQQLPMLLTLLLLLLALCHWSSAKLRKYCERNAPNELKVKASQLATSSIKLIEVCETIAKGS